MVSVNPYPISTFLKSLVVAVRLKLLFRYHFLINAARELAAEHLIQW